MTGKVDQILDDPAKSQVARRKQLNNIAKLPDDELAKLTPEQLKKAGAQNHGLLAA
ncbi:hypothetical protein B0A50_02200 [Salinomyces thailandicus]|uniref:Uncharacterized protein n=1 Tax=Salinomyces thailandicus TaxID=706561 RepID=A0A4U0UAQ7_9PEZI|nr:hypothetical protein B0A50_02200 [Salinomyces thailandica]